MSTTVWEAALALPISPARDHIRGSVDAPVELVEYGDFECPYCRQAHGIVNAVQQHMGDELMVVFRHFPLTTVHPHAEQAAEAAEAAGAQGRFWAMHDRLFEYQPQLDFPDLLAHAAYLGLDIDRFERELIERVHAPKVREDFMSGVYSGVSGTPTFFINGLRHDGPWDFATLLAALQRMA
jgi:protein-disulfide isomerase